MMAAGRGHKAIVARLLRVPGIEVNTVDGLGRTALMEAAGRSRSALDEGFLLLYPVLRNYPATVDALLQQPGITCNAVDEIGQTALMIAAQGDDAGIVSQLLRHPRVDVNAVDHCGRTALDLAREEARKARERVVVERERALPYSLSLLMGPWENAAEQAEKRVAAVEAIVQLLADVSELSNCIDPPTDRERSSTTVLDFPQAPLQDTASSDNLSINCSCCPETSSASIEALRQVLDQQIPQSSNRYLSFSSLYLH